MTKVISSVDIKSRQTLDIRSGDTLKVTQKIIERDKKTGKPKTRLQVFEGICLALKHGKQAGSTFTVRKTASGVGVERIFPLYSPMIEKIEVTKRSKVRQSKLYHIRDKAAKEIRRQMRNIQAVPEQEEVKAEEEVVAEEKTEENKDQMTESSENTETTEKTEETKE